jgi:hypothetical protein
MAERDRLHTETNVSVSGTSVRVVVTSIVDGGAVIVSSQSQLRTLAYNTHADEIWNWSRRDRQLIIDAEVFG